MRVPNHIILDLEVIKLQQTSNSYWALNCSKASQLNRSFLNNNNVTKLSAYKWSTKKSPLTTVKIEKLTDSNFYSNLQLFVDKSIANNTNLYANSYHSLVNVNFLRKERLYTKLKYSRSPAYDIVSGGAAALLAGFIGFLISEKFGFELVDSGDFYFLLMYFVFLSFMVRPLLTSVDAKSTLTSIFGVKDIINFYLTLLFALLKRFK